MRSQGAGVRGQQTGDRSQETEVRRQKSGIVILRHDVDKMPGNSLSTAKIEHELGIKGSYYFRLIPESFDEAIIKKIAGMGHEIGYHYEELDLVRKKIKVKSKKDEEGVGGRRTEVGSRKSEVKLPFELIDKAYEMFKENLAKLRSITPVTTICMHGSPLSKYDNKIIWTKYDYREAGIIGEPYFDIDWNEFAYLTDTGRRWDGEGVSVRDKVRGQRSELRSQKSEVRSQENKKRRFSKTQDIIDALERGDFPDKVMITVHPQRWNDGLVPRVKELVLQNMKNVVKGLIVRVRSREEGDRGKETEDRGKETEDRSKETEDRSKEIES